MPTDRTRIRKASAVYARALLEVAQGAGVVFEVSGQLEEIRAIVRDNPDLRSVLTDRMIPQETRTSLVKEVFAGFDPSLVAVLGVMVERDDIGLLARVNEVYIDLAEEALDVVLIDVTTVVGLDDNLRVAIKEKYSAQFGKGVLLREHIDPALVGGFVLSTHGRRIDASVVSQLDNARAVLSQA